MPDWERFDRAVALCLAIHVEVTKEKLFASFVHVFGSDCGLTEEQVHRRYLYLNRGELVSL